MALAGGRLPPGMEGMSPEVLRMMLAMQGMGGMGVPGEGLDDEYDEGDDYDEDGEYDEVGEDDDDGWETVDDDDDGEEGDESGEGPPAGDGDGGNRIEEISTPQQD